MKYPSAYLKIRVLGAIEFAPGKTLEERTKSVAQMTFQDEEGNNRQFTWRTIQTWWWYYRKYGVTHLELSPRADKGKTRKITPQELLEAVEQVLPLFRKGDYNKAAIYKACIEKGVLRREQIAPNTFSRFIREHELLKEKQINPKLREAWGKQYANQMWQADTMFGPHLKRNGEAVQSKLIAFIDDASRVVTHGEFFLSEGIESFVKALQMALYKRGIPEQLYVDNGAVYTSKEITLICARLGCFLSHAPLADGAAKGKIERFFRTVRESFLCRNLDLSSVEVLNKQFIAWLEEEYNAKTHSTIGMRPIDRFGLDLKRIKFLPPSVANDELFFMEEDRTVRKDNTFSLKSSRYEAPRDLREKIITLRFDRNLRDRIVVYYKNERMGEARLLDVVQNDRFHRNGGEA